VLMIDAWTMLPKHHAILISNVFGIKQHRVLQILVHSWEVKVHAQETVTASGMGQTALKILVLQTQTRLLVILKLNASGKQLHAKQIHVIILL
jgi:hypothetical protein